MANNAFYDSTWQSPGGGGSGITEVDGTLNRITVTNGTVLPIVDISASFVGQTSITTLGTIATGVWNGTAITDTYITSLSVSKLTGTTLPASIVNSSLTKTGALVSGSIVSGFGGAQFAGNVIADTDATYDLGASGANRFRDLFLSRNIVAGGTITPVGGLGGVLTIGTHLTGTSYNGSTGITIATDAVSTNTVSTIVARDGSGNFSAGTITASLTGSISGNAATATALQTSRNINGVGFDGTASITVTAAAGTLTGATLNSGVTASSLTLLGTLGADLLFTDASFDIGKVGATRPRDGWFSRNFLVGGTLTIGATKIITLGGNLTFSGAFAATLTITNTTTVTLPVTGTLSTLAGTETLTNKWIQPRVVNTTQSATPAINTDVTDVSHITALAQAVTSFTTNLTGTPVAGQRLIINITDNGTARGITWGASFEASTVALPTTTVISTRLDIGFIWNEVTTKWRCVAVA